MSKDGGNPDVKQDGAAKDDPNKKEDPLSNPKHKKIIRLVTVMAYMVSVSFVGVTLSAYYLFFWHPPNPRLIKRAHIVAEPRIEFLLSDPTSIFPNQSVDQESISKLEKNSPTALVARISDDSLDEANEKFMDTLSQVSGKKRRKLNESLFVLRNSLMEVLVRGKVKNQSAVPSDSSLNNQKTDGSFKKDEGFDSTETAKFSKSDLNRETSSVKVAGNKTDLTRRKILSKIRNPALKNYNDTSLTLESWTISGDEGKYSGRFANNGNGSSLEFGLEDAEKHQVDYNETRSKVATREKDEDYVSFLSTSNPNSTAKYIRKKNTRVNDSIRREVIRNTADSPSSEIPGGAAIDYKDTQIEKIANTTTTTTTRTNLPNVGDENSRGSEIPVTSPRRKDFLTIIIESTTKGTEIPSKIPTTALPEDLRTNSSVSTKNRPETSLLD